MICESVILAAGFGTRMKSKIPKVLHRLSEKPLIWWTVQLAQEATGRAPTVVVGPEMKEIRDVLDDGVHYVEQNQRLGTGHALLQVATSLAGKSDLVLVTLGDMPLLKVETLKNLIKTQAQNEGPMTLLTAKVKHARQFGRIVRDENGLIQGIVEEADASLEQLEITEVNPSVYCFEANWLWETLPSLPISAKGEYYLTDILEIATRKGLKVASMEAEEEEEIIGINTRVHLAEAQAVLKERINRDWMLSGVTILDPDTTYIGPEVEIGKDTTIMPNTTLEGESIIGEDCSIGPNSIVRQSIIGDRCKVFMSMMEGATLEDEVDIGPFAHLRKGAYLCRGVHMGNFGEVKNSKLGPGVKMGHFSYVGDTSVGENTNVSAGVITCNYDGKNKHETEIGENVFLGSDTMLVAPLRVGKGARTGAGSVVTKDVPENTLVAGIPARAIRKVEESE
jgi:bifunctional UDP-N-acetylglucosamine pyrophosphorylase/glucosamine-1-phosphate N-acetyltransferase